MILCVLPYQQALNVDLSHIEVRISEMIKHDRSLTLLHGEIIERCVFFLFFVRVFEMLGFSKVKEYGGDTFATF